MSHAEDFPNLIALDAEVAPFGRIVDGSFKPHARFDGILSDRTIAMINQRARELRRETVEART